MIPRISGRLCVVQMILGVVFGVCTAVTVVAPKQLKLLAHAATPCEHCGAMNTMEDTIPALSCVQTGAKLPFFISLPRSVSITMPGTALTTRYSGNLPANIQFQHLEIRPRADLEKRLRPKCFGFEISIYFIWNYRFVRPMAIGTRCSDRPSLVPNSMHARSNDD